MDSDFLSLLMTQCKSIHEDNNLKNTQQSTLNNIQKMSSIDNATFQNLAQKIKLLIDRNPISQQNHSQTQKITHKDMNQTDNQINLPTTVTQQDPILSSIVNNGIHSNTNITVSNLHTEYRQNILQKQQNTNETISKQNSVKDTASQLIQKYKKGFLPKQKNQANVIDLDSDSLSNHHQPLGADKSEQSLRTKKITPKVNFALKVLQKQLMNQPQQHLVSKKEYVQKNKVTNSKLPIVSQQQQNPKAILNEKQKTPKSKLNSQVEKIDILQLKNKLQFSSNPKNNSQLQKQKSYPYSYYASSSGIIDQNKTKNQPNQFKHQKLRYIQKNQTVPNKKSLSQAITQDILQEKLQIKDSYISKTQMLRDNSRIAKKATKIPSQTNSKKSSQRNSLMNEQFFRRRTNQEGDLTDLAVMSLDEVVEECFKHHIIRLQIYSEYVRYSTEQKIVDFINLFVNNDLRAWNFKELKITIMDHRRLSEILVRLHPNQYKIGAPYALNIDIRQFLINLYQLSGTDYIKLLDSLDAISKITFWKTMQIKYEHLTNTSAVVSPLASKNYKPGLQQKPEQSYFEQIYNIRQRYNQHQRSDYINRNADKINNKKRIIEEQRANQSQDENNSSLSSEQQYIQINKAKRVRLSSPEAATYSSQYASDKYKKRQYF